MGIAVVIAICGPATWHALALARALPSVQQQTDAPEETIFLYEPDATVEEVRNRGAIQASSEWLCFLDGDDQLEAGYIAAMRAATALDLPARRLIAPAMEDLDDRTGRVLQARRLPNTHRPMTEMNHCCIGTLVPRSLFLEADGFHEGYRPWEDWELWLRCIRAGACIDYAPQAVYLAHVRKDSRHRSITQEEGRILHSRITAEHEEGLRATTP